MGLLDKIHARLEIYRLEQRYARRKNRSAFTTGAQYVDGEYVFPTSIDPSPTTSTATVSKHSTGSGWRSQSKWGAASRR